MGSMEQENPKFDPKMEEPQKHALLRHWVDFKDYFRQNPTDLMEPFNLAGNTAIHVAARSDNLDLLRELLNMLPDDSDRRWQALTKGNAHENTLLHQAVLCDEVKMVDTVLGYAKKLNEHGDKNLLELRNDLGETPVYRAAKYGRLRMLKHMAKYVGKDMEPHLYREIENKETERKDRDSASILHIAIIGQHFDVASWLINKGGIDYEKVASAPEEEEEEEEEGINEKLVKPAVNEGINNNNNNNDEKQETGNEGKKKNKKNRLSCLQLLSRMPSTFRSYNSQAGFAHNLIYLCLPNKGYDEDEDGFITENKGDLKSRKNKIKKSTSASAGLPNKGYNNDEDDEEKGNLESGQNKVKKSTSSSTVSSTIHYAFWKLVAKEWDSVKEIWKIKKKNMQAEEVANFLVSIDNNSWRDTKHGVARTEVVVPVIQPSNVAATKKALLEKTTSFQKPIPCKHYTPLLLAASTGIIEIVEKIIDVHPDAISHVSPHDEQNVLHVAVKHRQKHIYKHLKKYKALKGLASHIDGHNRTLLHQVARMDYYDGGNQPGVVFQLQEELHWFERVKKRVPRPYQLFCNNDDLTARELFDLEHSQMLKDAQEWIKSTAQSCSAVSVLVATVVFAAAYTVPGGIDEHGVPNFLNSPLFLFFTVMDVVGLASSLISVMLFLSILTSPFQMQEFYKSLPRKLTMGFTLLFISLTSTMLAFGSTILLTIRMEDKKWSSSLIYSITFFPVTLFGLTQFPIVMAVKYRLKRLWKNVKKIIPNDIISMSTTKPTCKRDYSKYL